MHVSDKLLQEGFEIDPNFKFPVGKNEHLRGIFAMDSNLTLVNYNNKVAFVVKAGAQQAFLEKNPKELKPCKENNIKK